MNIDKKAAHYLRNSWIDFQTFYIFDIIPQNKDDAVIILAPLHPEEDHVFFVWYQGKRYPYYNIGQKKLRRMAEDNLGVFSVYSGNRYLIIRPKFEEFILNSSEI